MKSRDGSGYILFSEGEIGAAHVLAHELFDSGRFELGRHRLGQWLDGRIGTGSDWAHIQFHQAVFEIAAGDWKSAYARFIEELLPIAATSEDALTDAPALAWRLALAAGRNAPLPWDTLRASALRSTRQPQDPFVELHSLLALVGAGDLEGAGSRLDAICSGKASGASGVLEQVCQSLIAYAQRNFRVAANLLRTVIPELSSIGGSLAQNALFTELQARAAAA